VIAGVFSPSGTASNEPNEPVIPQTTTSQTMPSTTTTPTHDPNLSKPVLPPRAKPAPQAQLVTLADGRKLYDRIVVDAAKTTIFFRLITQAGAMSRPPFYIMEHKVWAGLYREGTREAGISPTMTPAEHDDEPALGMTAIAAEEFARLILNGALPSPEEWDAAAGWENQGGRSGPNLPSAKIAVDRERPARVNRDQANGDDVTPLGLRDLCGNGREFTDTLATTPRRKFTIEDNDQALVILRGRNYTLATPLDYSHLAIQQTQPQTQFLRTPSRYTGFRVVLRLP
jgi:formylglycine-generating enzyme required for sulfatase activity